METTSSKIEDCLLGQRERGIGCETSFYTQKSYTLQMELMLSDGRRAFGIKLSMGSMGKKEGCGVLGR